MAQSGQFLLLLKDDRVDKYFTARDYLYTRLRAIKIAKEAAGDPMYVQTFEDVRQTHLLFINTTYKPYVPITSEYVQVKASGNGTSYIGQAGGSVQFTCPTYGHFTNDIVVNLRFKAIGNAFAERPSAQNPLFRYCAYPGFRAIRKAEFRSESILIDDCTTDDLIMDYKFFSKMSDKPGWERCLGQESTKEATFRADNYTGVFNYRDGLQTWKTYHEATDLFIPLPFWFCKDVSGALSNELVSNSKRIVTCEFASMDELVKAAVISDDNEQNIIEIPLPFTKLAIDVDLYVNNLFVDPEIHSLFQAKVGFSLARVHKRQTSPLNNIDNSVLLDQLKFPAEYLMIGVRDRTMLKDFDKWWLMGYVDPQGTEKSLFSPIVAWDFDEKVWYMAARQCKEITTLTSVVESISMTSSGVDIFPVLPAPFYNSYIPIKYREHTMVSAPQDTGTFLVNFCLFAGMSNPSGYYNSSTGKELYIHVKTKDTGIKTLDLVISMSALNFIIRNGDAVELKFTI